jgi:GT2 family glycosyltransferase
MNRKVIIFLVNYNSGDDTLECINSIFRSDYSDFYIVVVDNSSTDNSFQKFADFREGNASENKDFDPLPALSDSEVLFCDCLVFVKTSKNLGFAGGNNFGLSYAKNLGLEFEYAWFLNNDTIIEEDTLSVLVDRMDSERRNNSKVGVLGNKLLQYSHPEKFQGVGGLYNRFTATCKPMGENEIDEGQFNLPKIEVDYPIGASLFVSTMFIDAVGLMKDDYFLFFEELDWVIRGKECGFNFGYEFKAKVFHKIGNSTNSGKNRLGKIADNCQVRNRIIFTYRFYPFYLFSVIPATFLTVLKRLLRGQFQRAYHMSMEIAKTLFSVLSGKIKKR